MHILYTVKSKEFNVLSSSYKFGFNQNLEIEVNLLSLEIEMQRERTVAKNKIYAFRCRYFVMRV